MIYEYALEPGVVATWGEQLNARFFIRAFGIAQGRYISCYPENWEKKVRKIHAKKGNAKDRKRLITLLEHFGKTAMVKRKDYVWDYTRDSWFENALKEHERHPFHAILAKNNPAKNGYVICENDFDAPKCPQWDIPIGVSVLRTAQDLANAVKSMLFLCSWVRFVDPYINNANKAYLDSFSEFFRLLCSQRQVGPPKSIEIHTQGYKHSADHVEGKYKKIIPTGMKVTLYGWQEKSDAEGLHNRYILTDLGGVKFGWGLDAGKRKGTSDDINRLSEEQYNLRCTQYKEGGLDFEKIFGPVVIVGEKKIAV